MQPTEEAPSTLIEEPVVDVVGEAGEPTQIEGITATNDQAVEVTTTAEEVDPVGEADLTGIPQPEEGQLLVDPASP